MEQDVESLHSGLQITLSRDAPLTWRGLCCFMWHFLTVYHLLSPEQFPRRFVVACGWERRYFTSHSEEGEKTLSLICCCFSRYDGNEGECFLKSYQAASAYTEIWQIDHVWLSTPKSKPSGQQSIGWSTSPWWGASWGSVSCSALDPIQVSREQTVVPFTWKWVCDSRTPLPFQTSLYTEWHH